MLIVIFFFKPNTVNFEPAWFLPLCSPTWTLPCLQDHMAGDARSLSPRQCAVMDVALDTIKVGTTRCFFWVSAGSAAAESLL